MFTKIIVIALLILGLSSATVLARGTAAAKPTGQVGATKQYVAPKFPHRKPRNHSDTSRYEKPQGHADQPGMPPHDPAGGLSMEPDGM